MDTPLQSLIEIIDQSPLSPEDKVHWKELLPRMTDEQKQHLSTTLIRKTELTKSIASVNEALNVIQEAEAEVDEDVTLEDAMNERDKLLDEIGAMEDAMPDLKSQGAGDPKPPSFQQPPTQMAPDSLDLPIPDVPSVKTNDEDNRAAPNTAGLEQDKKKSETRMLELREQLKQLSRDVGGTIPPSYK